MKKSQLVFLVILLTLVTLVTTLIGSSCAGPKQAPTAALTIALSTLDSETFLPWNGGGGRTPYLSLINENLLYVDPKSYEVKPGLATKWEMSPDGKVYTFTLRSGIMFHENYGELTSADAKYSLERLYDPKSVAGPAGNLRSLIDKVEAPEPYKLVIYMKSAYPELIRGYMTDNSQFLVVSKKYVESVGDEKANTRPIGTGPYTLIEEHKKGGPIKLSTVPGVEKHWRITPQFKNVTFLLVPEEATRVAMLRTGEVDLAPISYDSIDGIKKAGLQIFSIPKNWSPLVRMGGLVTTDPARTKSSNPWFKKEVRQAMNYAVDKASLVKNVFKSEASPSCLSIPIAPFDQLDPYPYDPTKAKQLLSAAGYPSGFPITFKTYTTNPGAELPMIGEAIAMYWKAVGIDVKIVPTDWVTVRGEWTGLKSLDYVWIHRGLASTDPLTAVITDFGYDKNLFCAYATKESQDYINKMSAELDTKKRDQIGADFGKYLKDEAPGVYTVFANEPYGASKKIGSWPTLRMRPMNIDQITLK